MRDTDVPAPDGLAEELVSACRTAVGDRLRSIAYFDASDQAQLYLRDDLNADADLVGFSDNERLGFRSRRVYGESELGDYRYTIRAFERGFLTRVIVGHHGAFVTTDDLSTDRFDDLASSVSSILEKYDDGS